MSKKLRSFSIRAVAVLAVLALGGALILSRSVNAANLTSISDTMTTLTQSVVSNHQIQFTTPSGVAEGQAFTVTFPAGFTLTSITEDDVDITDDASQLTTAADCTGSEKASVGVSGQVVTVTICAGDGGAISAGSVVVVYVGTNATNSGTGVNQITNPTAGAYIVDIDVNAGTDTGSFAVDILTNDTVNVTADVDPVLTFTISDNTIGFGTLSSSNAKWATGDGLGSASAVAAHNLTASTNANSGYVITYTGNTLTAGANTITAIGGSATASSPGSEQYGIKAVVSLSGSGAPVSPYNGSNYAFVAGSSQTLASASGATLSNQYDMYYIANISAVTEAALYTSNITYIATATF